MIQPKELTASESAYCFNKTQLERAHNLAEVDPESSPRIQEALAILNERLDRNERAALAFVLIDKLLKNKG